MITAMIGLATLAVSPEWMRHGYMGVVLCRGWNRITNSSRPSLSHGILAGLEGLPTSAVRGLCLESFLRRHHLLHRERRRAIGCLLPV